MEKVRALLSELKADEYVRFKYGKAIDAAIKTLEAERALNAREVEARLSELLELVRGTQGGAARPRPKSRPKKAPADALA